MPRRFYEKRSHEEKGQAPPIILQARQKKRTPNFFDSTAMSVPRFFFATVAAVVLHFWRTHFFLLPSHWTMWFTKTRCQVLSPMRQNGCERRTIMSTLILKRHP